MTTTSAMIRKLRTYTVATLIAGSTIVTGAGPAGAAPDSLGCPNGWTTYQTSFLLDHGFSPVFLAQVDINQDGIICGTPLSPQQQKRFCAQFPDGCQQPVILATRDNTNGKGY